MFTLTAKTHYGVLAVIELARHHGNGLLQIRDIVGKHAIPKNYLEQIFNRLSKQGIIKSVRGNKGGYQLSDVPRKIMLLQVLEALEGDIEFSHHDEPEMLRQIFAVTEQMLKNEFSISLAQLLENEDRISEQVMFHI